MAIRKVRAGPGNVVAISEPDPATSSKVEGKTNAELIERARKNLMEAVPETATALANQAKTGSFQHIKLLLQVTRLDEGGLATVVEKPREKTIVQDVTDGWNQEP